MNHKLAKQLKEAGFPHNWCDYDFKYCDEDCFPTLSELINACGENLYSLSRHGVGWLVYGGRGKGEDKNQEMYVEVGKSPEEAVVKLYLKLNAPKT